MISGREETRIQQLLDGDLPEAEWPELRGLLEISEEARRVYCMHARIRSQFDFLLRERMVLAAPAVPVGYLVRSQRRRHIKLAGIAAAAIIVLSLAVMRLVLVRQAADTASLSAAANTVFSVSHADGNDDAQASGRLGNGSRLQVEQGVVELEFGSGVRSVVRGPADLTVVREGELRFDRGTGWFHVPRKAVGFRVATPRAMVTDLGTEFGVIARPDLADSVHLFKGSVEVRTRIGAGDFEVLRGEAARNITLVGRLQTAEPRLQSFFTSLPAGLPSLGWSFDEANARAWVATGASPEAASVRGRPSPSPAGIDAVPGRFGNALRGKGGTAWITDWAGIAGNSPRTLAFWLKIPPRDDYISPIAGWGRRQYDDDSTLSSFFAFAETVEGVTVVGASLGGYWIKGSSRIDDDRWHHLAITASGRQLVDGRPELRLYVDGREESGTPFWSRGLAFSESEPLVMATDTTHPEARPLSVLSQLFPGVEDGHAFPASLDELRVFEGVLRPGDIQVLYRENLGPSEVRESR